MATLTNEDLEVAGPGVQERAAELFHEWQETCRLLREAVIHDPAETGDAVARADRVEVAANDYLVEFVEVHELNYSGCDPRNRVPGKAEEPES